MRNYPNQNKHFYQATKNNRYQRPYKPSLNIDDYLNFNAPYSNKQGQEWDDSYNYTYQDGNATTRSYYNKNYYNGQRQRYNHYPKYEKEDNYMPHFNTSSNYNDDNTQSFPKINNDYNDLDEKEPSKSQFKNMPTNILIPTQKYSSKQQQKTLKVAKSLTDLSEAKSSNTNEFNLKRNFPSKEEVLRVKITLNNEVKDIIVYKNDDCAHIAKTFVEQNSLPKKLIQPISIKLNYALERITNILMEKVSKEEVELLDNIKTLSKKNNNNYYHHHHLQNASLEKTPHEKDIG